MPVDTKKIWKNELDPTLAPGVDPAIEALEMQRFEDKLLDLKTHMVYDVKGREWGAVGNGTGNDGAIINAAITAASATGFQVWMPPGTYRTTEPIIIKNGVTLRGAGRYSIIKIADTTDINAIEADTGPPGNIVMQDFAIDCNKANNVTGTKGKGIYGSFTYTTIDNVQVFNCKNIGIDVGLQFVSRISRCRPIEGDIFSVQLTLTDAWFDHNYCVCTNATPAAVDCRAGVFNGGPMHIDANHFEGGRNGVFMNAPQWVRFTNNIIEFNQRENLLLVYPSGYGDGALFWTITGNHFKSANVAVGAYSYVVMQGYDATHRIGDAAFSNNFFVKGTTAPVYVLDLLNAINIRGEGNIWRGQYSGGAAVNLGANTSLIAVNGG